MRAHAILCWLALFTLGTFTSSAGTFRETAELTKTQRDLLAKLGIPTRSRSSRPS
jgi:hypothetical protein